MKKLVFLLLCICSSSVFADTDINELIDRLTEITNSTTVEIAAPYIEEYSTGLAESIASFNPNFTSETTDLLKNEISIYINEKFFVNKEIKEKKYTLYKKYYTAQDLEQLVDFYESELGKKVLQVTPEVIAEYQKNISLGLISAFSGITYRDYLTEIEYAKYMEFIESALGKKISEVSPRLLSDIYQASIILISSIDKNLAVDIGPRINKKLDEYYKEKYLKEKYNNTFN